jgi:hypothetical protein
MEKRDVIMRRGFAHQTKFIKLDMEIVVVSNISNRFAYALFYGDFAMVIFFKRENIKFFKFVFTHAETPPVLRFVL